MAYTPQVTITLVPGSDYALQIETFVNGSRKVERLPEGFELTAIRCALAEQKALAKAFAAAEREKEAARERARRNTVFNYVALNHPTLAEKVKGKPTMAELDEAAKKRKTTITAEMLDEIDF